MVAGLCALPVLNKSLLMEFCFDHDEEKMLQFIASHKNETKRIIRLWLEPDSVQSNKCKPMPGRKKNRA